MKIHQIQSHKGFTLMEVMVAVSIFAIVVTVGIGALLTINNNYKKAQTSRQAVDSLTFILESMSRSIRTAQEWDPNHTNTTYRFEFLDQDGVNIVYELAPGEVFMTKGTDDPVRLNPGNVFIDQLLFTQSGGMGQQSYLQINLTGTVTLGQDTSNFAFQTGVSKRSLDVVPSI
jgi:prepilin-type N-terminal cleavage/methylation domain-containing protein